MPCAPANPIVASLPITCAPTCVTTSAITGLTLPGMIDEPGCRSGSRISASPVRGPLAHPPQVVRDLHERDRERAQLPARLHQRVARALRGEVVVRLDAAAGRCVARAARSPCAAKPFGALMPVPTAVPPSGSTHKPRQRVAQARDAVVDLRRVAAELLAQRDRRRVHQVRAARPSRRARTRAASCASAFTSFSAAGTSSSTIAVAAARCTADGNTSFDDCEAFTWSFGCTGAPARRAVRGEAREHLVHVHVRRRTRAGLERTSIGNCVVVRAGHDLVGRGDDRVADPPVDSARRGAPRSTVAASRLDRVRARGSRRSSTGSPEIGKFSTARCVCAPQSASTGTSHVAHRVVLDAVLGHGTSAFPENGIPRTRPLP